MNSKIEYVKATVVKGKNGLEVKPDFADHAVYFHPVPRNMQSIVKEGFTYTGHFGKPYDTGKKDVRGKRIYIKYFIPWIPNERQLHEIKRKD